MSKYQLIIDNVGGVANILSITNCMTRLRLTLKNETLVQEDNLKQNNDILAVLNADGQLQIVLQPGLVTEYANQVQKLIGTTIDTTVTWQDTKKDVNKKYNLSISSFLKKIANIFSPLIPALIAAGLLGGIANVIQNYYTAHHIVELPSYYYILRLINNAFMGYLLIFIGVNAAKEFGATPVLGGIIGGIGLLPNLDATAKSVLHINGSMGGVFGLLFACYILAKIEHIIRRLTPNTLTILITPTLSVLVTSLIMLYAIMPLDHMLSNGITYSFDWLLNFNPIISGYIFSAAFLPLVMLGIHQGLMPIYFNQITQVGYTNIYPVVAMGGAGGFGAAIAIYFRTKDLNLKKTILSVLPISALGVGEPLIYSVTLPLGRPFVTSCLGAGFGGMWIAYSKVASLAIGPSGLALIPLIKDGYINYVIGLLIAYIGGFLVTYFFGLKNINTK